MDSREMARLGGLARAKKMTKKQRSESARHAVAIREKLRKKRKKLSKVTGDIIEYE